jgi:hypothetical protein
MPRRLLPLALLALAACQAAPPSTPVVVTPPTAVAPLDLLTRLTLPPSAQTVAGAAAYLLEPTGYRLVAASPESAEIARKPISPLGLRPQLTTIKRALVLVAGSNTRLLIDDQHHEVAFAYYPEAQP